MNFFIRIALACLLIIYASLSKGEAAEKQPSSIKNTTYKNQPQHVGTSKNQYTPKKIITLAPHLSELVYALGKGKHLIGTVEHSDFPDAAKHVPRIGNHNHLNLEKIIALKPDIILGWKSGNDPNAIKRLTDLELKVYMSEPRSIDDIIDDIKTVAKLINSEDESARLIGSLHRKRRLLAEKYNVGDPKKVFYQIWHQPVYTIGGGHIISEAITLCGGTNIFADLSTTAPQISIESVILRQPDIIISTEMPTKNAINWQHLFKKIHQKIPFEVFIDPDKINRPGPRFLSGIEEMCRAIASAITQDIAKAE